MPVAEEAAQPAAEPGAPTVQQQPAAEDGADADATSSVDDEASLGAGVGLHYLRSPDQYDSGSYTYDSDLQLVEADEDAEVDDEEEDNASAQFYQQHQHDIAADDEDDKSSVRSFAASVTSTVGNVARLLARAVGAGCSTRTGNHASSSAAAHAMGLIAEESDGLDASSGQSRDVEEDEES